MGLYQRADSPWWWYRLEGTSIRKSTGIPHTGTTPEQTRDLKRDAQAIYIVAKATHVKQGPLQQKPTISFADLATWYETHHLAHQRGVARATSMLGQIRRYFARTRSIADLTAQDGREWMSQRRTEVSPATVNRELDLLKAVLKAAVPRYLDATPFGDVRRYRLPEQEARVLTRDEETRLLAVGTPLDRAFLIMALDTLLRLSSLLALQWPQVKFAHGTLVPLNAKIATDAKPMSSRLKAALQALPREGPYVFHWFQHAGSPRNAAIRRFAALCAQAHVPHGRALGGITIHCLRHTGATRALERGASLRTVMKLGGWRRAETVLRYLHVADADVRAAAESIGRDADPPVTSPARTPQLRRIRRVS